MTVGTCGDCGEVYTRQDGHRCETTVLARQYRDALGSFVDGTKRVADLERQVAHLTDANARYRALGGTWRAYASEREVIGASGQRHESAFAQGMKRCASELEAVDG